MVKYYFFDLYKSTDEIHEIFIPPLHIAMANHHLFLACFAFLFLSYFSHTISGAFISIDCGSSISYKDENGIVWTGDSPYVVNGESRSVQPANNFTHVLDTMRVFTTRKKNCYSINNVTRGRVLVRAHFFYGNYDGRSSPPTFALSFDGNAWAQVTTSTTSSYYYEVIYVMKKDSISICVAQTEPGQFPFISAITARSLEMISYANIDDDHPLYMTRRVAFGSNTTIRYPDDPYDRYWSPNVYENGTIKVSNNAVFSDSVVLKDRIPPAVLKNAVTAITPESSIELYMRFSSIQSPVYINWYFSEVRALRQNEIRAFRIFKGAVPYSSTIIPSYGNVTQLSVGGLLASSSDTISLVPTNYSTLPPLINAMEVFDIGDALTNGTNTTDVRGLASLQNAFGVLRDWNGDPCLPSPYSWDWIICNNNRVPRVTTLSLKGYNLSGSLPDFSSMDALTKIDLSNNRLQGPIPDFLGNFPELQILILENNEFGGTVPPSLSRRSGLRIMADGNPGLICTTCSTGTKISSAERKQKKVLEPLLATITIISSLIILKLGFGEV